MRFIVKNIGKIPEFSMKLDDITIIAGENNTGKSTIGKALFAYLDQMDYWADIYNKNVSSAIANLLRLNSNSLENWCKETFHYSRSRTRRALLLIDQVSQSEELSSCIEDYQLDQSEEHMAALKDQLADYCLQYIRLYGKKDVQELKEQHSEFVNQWVEGVLPLCLGLELSEQKLQARLIASSLQEVFGDQFGRFGTETSEVELDLDGSRSHFSVRHDGTEAELTGQLNSAPGVYFVESPKIFDFLSNDRYGHVQKEYLRYLMSPNVFFKRGTPEIEENDKTMLTEPLTPKLAAVLQNIQKEIHGRAVYKQKVGLEYQEEGSSESVHARNVSMGVKSLALLEYAIRIGAIRPGDILILDEPELNLHPDWQKLYGEILVRLAHEFHIHILVTSHSPYFIRAIEVYTDHYDCMDELNVYHFFEDEKKGFYYEDVMESEYGMTELYDQLSHPLDELDRIVEKGTDGET